MSETSSLTTGAPTLVGKQTEAGRDVSVVC